MATKSATAKVIEAGSRAPEQPSLLPVEPVKRGPGRPAGSGNRAGEPLRQYLRARHGSPLEHLARTAAMSLQELADELGLAGGLGALDVADRIDLLKLRQQAAIAAVPYLEARLPLAVESTAPRVQLVITDQAPESVMFEADEVMEFQDLSGGAKS